MSDEASLLIVILTVCTLVGIFFGLWQQNVWAGFFAAFFSYVVWPPSPWR